MTCEQARAAIADSILAFSQSAASVLAAEVDVHVESCETCRAFRHECRTIWAALAQLPIASPSSDARAHFDVALRDVAVRDIAAPTAEIPEAEPRTTPWSRPLFAAASLLVAALAGYVTASWKQTAGATSAITAAAAPVADSQTRFLLLLYDDTARGPKPSTAEMSGIIAEYSAWAGGLARNGRLVVADKLVDTERSWLGGASVATDDFTIGGFVLFRAHDLAEAQRIAATCPHAKRGRVELRTIQPT